MLWFIDGECREMVRENKKVEAMPTCYCLTFMCCQPCLPVFQCYQIFLSWKPLAFSSAMSVMP